MACITEVVEVVEFVAEASSILADLLNSIPNDSNNKKSLKARQKKGCGGVVSSTGEQLTEDPQQQAQEIVNNSTISSGNDFLQIFKYTYAGTETAPPNYDQGKAILPGQSTLVMKSIANTAAITTYVQQTFKVSGVINNNDMNNFAQQVTTWLSNSLTTPNLWVQNTFSKQVEGLNNDTIEYDVQFTAVYANDTQNNISFYLLTYTSCVYGAISLLDSVGSTGFSVVNAISPLYNVVGSTGDPKIEGKTWVQLLRDSNINGTCYVMNTDVAGPHTAGNPVWGGHMTTSSDGQVATGGIAYLMPICPAHNNTSKNGIPFTINTSLSMLKLTGYNQSLAFNDFINKLKLPSAVEEEEFVYFYRTKNWKLLYADVPNILSKSYPFICYSLRTRKVVNKHIDNFEDLYEGFFEFILSTNKKNNK